MRILEMVERIAQAAEAEGGMKFVTPAGSAAGPSGGTPPGADPHWRPAPNPAARRLAQDPDFSLPTTAGPLTWRIFHESTQAGTDSEWGFGRRASFPLRLMSDGTTVTVMHDDGTDRQYLKVGAAFQVVGAKNG